MAEPWKEAVELVREYSQHLGHEWPGFSANDLLHRIQIQDGQWSDWSLMSDVDRVLDLACFNVDELLQDYLGVKIIVEDLTELDAYAGSPVFGYAQPGMWAISICPRAKRYLPLYRATVMHELGHLLLHSAAHPRMLAYTPLAPSRPVEEVEADQFMHVALLPRPVLWLASARFAACWRLNLHEVFSNANTLRGRWQWRHRILRQSIDKLAVSRQLICIKLRQMGVFDNETLRYHLSYALPNKWKPVEDRPLRRSIERIVTRFD